MLKCKGVGVLSSVILSSDLYLTWELDNLSKRPKYSKQYFMIYENKSWINLLYKSRLWAGFSFCNKQLRFYLYYFFKKQNTGNEGLAYKWIHHKTSPSAIEQFLWGKHYPVALVLIYVKEVWLTECRFSKYLCSAKSGLKREKDEFATSC